MSTDPQTARPFSPPARRRRGRPLSKVPRNCSCCGQENTTGFGRLGQPTPQEPRSTPAALTWGGRGRHRRDAALRHLAEAKLQNKSAGLVAAGLLCPAIPTRAGSSPGGSPAHSSAPRSSLTPIRAGSDILQSCSPSQQPLTWAHPALQAQRPGGICHLPPSTPGPSLSPHPEHRPSSCTSRPVTCVPFIICRWEARAEPQLPAVPRQRWGCVSGLCVVTPALCWPCSSWTCPAAAEHARFPAPAAVHRGRLTLSVPRVLSIAPLTEATDRTLLTTGVAREQNAARSWHVVIISAASHSCTFSPGLRALCILFFLVYSLAFLFFFFRFVALFAFPALFFFPFSLFLSLLPFFFPLCFFLSHLLLPFPHSFFRCTYPITAALEAAHTGWETALDEKGPFLPALGSLLTESH